MNWDYNKSNFLHKAQHYSTPNRIMMLCLKVSSSPVHPSVLWTCRFLDSPNYDPASPSLRSTSCISHSSLRLSRQRPRGSGFTSGRCRVPSWSHIVHEGLHSVKLGCQLSETLFQGVELLVEITQGVWQGLDPEREFSPLTHNKSNLHLQWWCDREILYKKRVLIKSKNEMTWKGITLITFHSQAAQCCGRVGADLWPASWWHTSSCLKPTWGLHILWYSLSLLQVSETQSR